MQFAGVLLFLTRWLFEQPGLRSVLVSCRAFLQEHGRLPTRGRAAPAEDAIAQRLDRLALYTEQSPLPDALALEFAAVLDAERELPAADC